MRVIELLKELNIALDTLRSYEPYVDFTFNVVNQSVPEEIYLKVIETHNDKSIQLEIAAKKKRQSNKNNQQELDVKSNDSRINLFLFQENDTYKFNAKVKWYYNQQTNGDYGFLEKKGLSDIQFLGRVFKNSNPKNLKSGEEVIVTVRKKDIDENNHNLKALKVNHISDETNLNYILFYFLNHIRILSLKNSEDLLIQIAKLTDQLNQDIIKSTETFLIENISFNDLEIEKLIQVFKLVEICSANSEFYYNKLRDLTPDKVFKLWLVIDELQIDYNLIKEEIVTYVKFNLANAQKILERLDFEQKTEILKAIHPASYIVDTSNKYISLALIINLYKESNIQFDYTKIPNNVLFFLWLNHQIDFFPLEAVYDKLIELNNEYFDSSVSKERTLENTKKIIQSINDNDLKNILAKTHYAIDIINDIKTFRIIQFFITNINVSVIKNEFVEAVYIKLTAYYRLQFFILDLTDRIEYNEVVIYTGLLSGSNQKIFFKKVIKLIAEEKINIGLEDLNRITTIDYEMSEYAKEIDGIGLDFTLNVLLKVITDLNNNIETKQKNIFDLIANQIKKPKDLLVIDGFFEICTGRTIIEENGSVTLDTGEHQFTYIKTKKEHFMPRFSTFCDGRKALIKGSDKSSLCKKSGFEFWWCENNQCYDVCRHVHNPSQWKNYTLEDILRILKIPYSNVQYEILLNVVNRVNRFLKHLTCRKCESILKPKGRANFAFYGVTMFVCQNQDCTEHSKDIYLSHCLNGHCEDIIDSRDGVKCKTHGFSDDCGWYICKNCNACCSSDKLQARKSILERTGQDYKCHIEGHRDRGVICCSDCGHEMIEPIVSIDLYQKQLNWFIEQKDKNPNIIKSGQRPKDNKWWFIWARGNFTYEEYRKQIKGLFLSGFSIPDFNNKEKDNQLIAEPFEVKKLSLDKVFVCPNCDHHFNMNNKENFDYTRKTAVQKFHNNIFPQINN